MSTYLSPGVYVEEVPLGAGPIAGVGTSTAAFVGAFTPPSSQTNLVSRIAKPLEIRLLTNFTEFREAFGDFSEFPDDAGHNQLAHAVYGFFNNGGTRCYVVRVEAGTDDDPVDLAKPLDLLETIDEISIVAAPGLATGPAEWELIAKHCRDTKTRFGIIDPPAGADWRTPPKPKDDNNPSQDPDTIAPAPSPYCAIYFPWISVYDPASKGNKLVPPSGHIAGVYARVDTQRGVHKAPANEPIFGALDLEFPVSQAKQDGLNPIGVNCIRRINGNILVWGARTVSSTESDEFKYVSTRRLFNFLRASIEQGTQWAVFEPNDSALWSKLTRNVSAFLTTIWGTGALFGLKPEEAFFVKCDAENNPPANREAGLVVAEIGVAISKPAEFVVFKIGQRAAAN